MSINARRHAEAVVVVALALTATACRDWVQHQPQVVTMRVGVGTPSSGAHDPGLSYPVSAMTAEPWLTSQSDGRQAERLATKWQWDDSRTTLRLELRPNVYFHDGTQLTPEVAAQALRTEAAHPEYASLRSITSVTVSGPSSVDLKLSDVNSFLLPDLSLVSVHPEGKPQIGTGPFQIVRQDPQHFYLSAFPRYYRGKPQIDQIEISSYPTQRAAWAALLRNDVDMLYEVSRDVTDFVHAETTLNEYTFPRPYYNTLVFNVRHPALRRADVRRAISEALDRDALIRDGMNGLGRVADGPLIPEHWAYAAPPAPVRYDPQAARAAFDAAGLTVHAAANAGSMPSRFAFTCLVFSNDSRFQRLAVLVQKQLAEVGVDMKLEPVTLEQFIARAKSGDFDAFLFEMAGRSLSWVYDFWHSRPNGKINSGYTSADAVLDRIRVARSDEDVKRGMADLAAIMQEDPPAAFLAWQTTSRAVSKRFDVPSEGNRDILSDAWRWRLADDPKGGSR